MGDVHPRERNRSTSSGTLRAWITMAAKAGPKATRA